MIKDFAYRAGYLSSAASSAAARLRQIMARGTLGDLDQFSIEMVVNHLEDALNEAAPPEARLHVSQVIPATEITERNA